MQFDSLRHPYWMGLVLPLMLAVISTFTPATVRGILLIAAVLAASLTFHQTEFAGRNFRKTMPVSMACIGLGIAFFYVGRYFDASKNKQSTVSQLPNVAPPIPSKSNLEIQPKQAMNDVSSTKIKSSSEQVPQVRNTQLRSTPSESPLGITNAPTGSGSAVGTVTAQPGSVVSIGQQGGITAGKVEINPMPPERTWQISIAKCDEWVKKLNALGTAKVSVGAFMSNNDGMRMVGILNECFKRSTWEATGAFLPINPDGVVIGASVESAKLEAVEAGLQTMGLRVTKHDIRPAYENEIGIVIGTNPIKP